MKRVLAVVGIFSLIVCLTVLLMTGCAKKSGDLDEEAMRRAAALAAQQEADRLRAEQEARDALERERALLSESMSDAELDRLIKERSKGDINFDFDSYILRPEAREMLKVHKEFMAKNKKRKVVIEGHCDEKGTSEYNLALGERRAAEAKKYLLGLGVEESKIKTVSYGKEMPLDPRHNEKAWATNRRDHFVFTPPK